MHIRPEIAAFLHISQNTYSQYESEKRQIPIALLIALASYYNVSVDYILGLTDTKKPYPKNKAPLRGSRKGAFAL